MPVFKRWKLEDSSGSYTFTTNPNAMSSPFGQRNIILKNTTAIDGQTVLMEGNRQVPEWTFSGDILDAAHYEALRSWVYDRLGRRVIVSDHFGRRIVCVLTKFDPSPKRSVGKYWRHTYTVTAVVVSVGAPTVSEVPA